MGLTADTPPPPDLWAKYAPLRLRKRGEPLTDDHKQAICDIVATEYLTIRRAGAIVGVKRPNLRKDPEWGERLETARAVAELYWTRKLQEAAGHNNNAGVKAAEFMLKAMNPKRYREDRDKGGPGIVVQVIAGREAVTIPEVQVVRGEIAGAK